MILDEKYTARVQPIMMKSFLIPKSGSGSSIAQAELLSLSRCTTAVSETLSWLAELGFEVDPEKVLIISDSMCAIIQTRNRAAHFESRVAHKVARIQLAMEQSHLNPYKNLGFVPPRPGSVQFGQFDLMPSFCQAVILGKT